MAAQARQFTKAGCKKAFRETAVGAQTDRVQLHEVLATLEADNVMMLTRLERLARSTRDLFNTLGIMTEGKAGFRSLGDTWAATTTTCGRLIPDGRAEFERALIRAPTSEGRECAKARGVKMRRLLKMTPHQIKEAIRRWDNDEPMQKIARSYKVGYSTIS